MFYDTYACWCQSVCVCLCVSVQLPGNRVGSLNPSKITGCYFYLSSQDKGGLLAYCHNKEAPDWLSSMIAPPSPSMTHTNTHTAITTPRLDFFVVPLFCLFVLVFVYTEPTDRGFPLPQTCSMHSSKIPTTYSLAGRRSNVDWLTSGPIRRGNNARSPQQTSKHEKHRQQLQCV